MLNHDYLPINTYMVHFLHVVLWDNMSLVSSLPVVLSLWHKLLRAVGLVWIIRESMVLMMIISPRCFGSFERVMESWLFYLCVQGERNARKFWGQTKKLGRLMGDFAFFLAFCSPPFNGVLLSFVLFDWQAACCILFAIWHKAQIENLM